MNKYGSNVKTFLAPNVIEAIISPPSLLSIVDADCQTQLVQAGSLWNRPQPIANPGVDDWNPNGNLIIHGAGLYGNFADGLIFSTPFARPAIKIWARSVQWSATVPAGQVSLAHSGKSLIGVGTQFTSDIAPVGPCLVPIQLWGTPALVTAVISDTAAVVSQYGGLITQNLVPTPPFISYVTGAFVGNLNDAVTVIVPAISTLNQTYGCDKVLPIAALYSALPRSGFLLFAKVLLNLEGTDTMDFQTLTVDPLFGRSIATFDIAIDLEITPR